MTPGRPSSVETLHRRLAAARKELMYALRFPHPYAGHQRQRLAVLEHRITVLVKQIEEFDQKLG